VVQAELSFGKRILNVSTVLGVFYSYGLCVTLGVGICSKWCGYARGWDILGVSWLYAPLSWCFLPTLVF